LDIKKEIEGIVPAILAIAKNPKAAKKTAFRAQKFVKKRQMETIQVLKSKLI
jgi:hypothetical protein